MNIVPSEKNQSLKKLEVYVCTAFKNCNKSYDNVGYLKEI